MKAVMYGGGNIGRGFIGALLSSSGYEVTFVDVAEPVVEALQVAHTYPVRYISSEGFEDHWVQNVTAVNGNDVPSVIDAIAECDIMATAVGARILKFIAPNIVAGLRKRWENHGGTLDIIICENLMDANKALEQVLKSYLTEAECERFDETVGLVEASIGRMVPVQTEEMKDGEPLRVCVENYCFLPVDKAAFKGKIPNILGMVPYEPFDFYIQRKLYVHNMGHATCAYLGNLIGLDYIYQAIAKPQIRIIVQNAMTESAMALSAKYKEPLQDLLLHISDLLYRFSNAALQDTCQRVGADPARKLSSEDRLIGAAKTAMEMHIMPAYIAVGAAAGILRYIRENEMEESEKSAICVLRDVCAVQEHDSLFELILSYVQILLSRGDLEQLCALAEQNKHEAQDAVI